MTATCRCENLLAGGPPVAGRLGGLVGYLRACLRVARERRDLARLDERMLHDIGIGPADVHDEASRTFWDVPAAPRRPGRPR